MSKLSCLKADICVLHLLHLCTVVFFQDGKKYQVLEISSETQHPRIMLITKGKMDLKREWIFNLMLNICDKQE